VSTLAERQAALVATLVAGAPVPPGFDARLVGVARTALLRKRAGEVARHWPMLAASFRAGWTSAFATWADGRPSNGSLRDGWDFARSRTLDGPAAAELAEREALWAYDGTSAPTRRPRAAATVRLWWSRR
jgi:hypothetical protein